MSQAHGLSIDARALLAAALRDGLQLWIEGGRLRWRGPRRAAERHLGALAAHRAEVLAVLAEEGGRSGEAAAAVSRRVYRVAAPDWDALERLLEEARRRLGPLASCEAALRGVAPRRLPPAWSEVWRRPRAGVDRCSACGGSRWWRPTADMVAGGLGDGWRCATCRPPLEGARVEGGSRADHT